MVLCFNSINSPPKKFDFFKSNHDDYTIPLDCIWDFFDGDIYLDSLRAHKLEPDTTLLF